MTSDLKCICCQSVLTLLVTGVLINRPLSAADTTATAATVAKTFTAVATLLIEKQEPSILPPSGAKFDEGEFETFRATQMQLIKSRPVIMAALRNPKIGNLSVIRRADAAHATVRILANAIRVQASDPHGGVITVSITTYDPQESAALVNAVVQAYMEEVVQYDRQKRRERLDDLQRISAAKETEFRTKKEQLHREAEALGIPPTPDAARIKLQLAADRVTFLQRQVLTLQDDRDRVNIEIKVAKDHGGETKALEQQQEILTERLSGCEKKLEKASVEVESLTKPSVAFEMASAVVLTDEKLLERLGEERETSRVNLNSSLRVRIIGDSTQPAPVPELPD